MTTEQCGLPVVTNPPPAGTRDCERFAAGPRQTSDHGVAYCIRLADLLRAVNRNHDPIMGKASDAKPS